jgi:hypothetical protein
MFAKKLILLALCGLLGPASGGGEIKDKASLKLASIETLNVTVAQLTAFASQCNRGMCEASGEVNRGLVDDRVQKILAQVGKASKSGFSRRAKIDRLAVEDRRWRGAGAPFDD